MPQGASGSPIEAFAYLARAEHRAPTLVAMTVRPRSRSELWELTGVSESTIRRTLREFEERGWIRRNEYRYEATQLGALIATGIADLLERLGVERQLRGVWDRLPGEESGFSLELCVDSVVSVAEADDPYRPVNRFVSLFESADDVRFVGVDVALLEPCKEALCEHILGGMRTEFINRPRVVEYIRSTTPELFAEALESGNLTVQLHDDLPSYGVCLFPDRVALAGYDPDGVAVRVLVDTDHPDAREWAEGVYETYRRRTPTLPLESMLE